MAGTLISQAYMKSITSLNISGNVFKGSVMGVRMELEQESV